jgi:uncharacterized protein (TIGR02996 family)
MCARLWYDQCREHEPLTPEQWSFCPQCSRCPCACIPDHYLRLESWSPFPSDRITPRGGDEERAFVFAISGNVADQTAQLVFADWLDEHGRTGEGAILRDSWASPIITPFRVPPYWRKAPLFTRLLRQRPSDPDTAILARRLKLHDEIHGGDFRVKVRERYTRILLLDDVEAVLAGIDRWPLLPREPEPIMRFRR